MVCQMGVGIYWDFGGLEPAIFDREDALAVLGIAFCQRVFYNVSRSFNNVFVKGSFKMLVGLLTMSTGLLTKVKLFVRGCFYKSSSCCLGLFE